MKIRKELAIAALVLLGVIGANATLHSADQPAPAAADQPDPPPPKIVTHVYDVRALIMPGDDFPFETSPHAPAFVVPANLQGGDISGYNGGGRVGMFSGGNVEKTVPTHEELSAQLTKSIMDLIDSDTWRDNGGNQGSMHELNGLLIVSQTEAAQKQIADFLQQISDLRNKPIRTTAEWLLLTPGELESLTKPPSLQSSGAAREVNPDALAKLPASARQFRAELPGHNGQTLHSLSGHEKSVTVNETATVGTGVAAYSPFIAVVADGVAIQVTPNVDSQRHTAVVTLFSTFNTGQEQGPLITLRSIAATSQPTPDNAIANSSALATYHEVGSTVQEFRTTLRIPLNTPVIAGSMTLHPTGKDADARELVLVISVQSAQ
jgi:hypothetical protein